MSDFSLHRPLLFSSSLITDSYLLTFGSPIGVSGVSRGGPLRILICETRFSR